MRLFTALYPSEAALVSLDLALGGIGGAALGDTGPGLRWVPRDQRHVTVVFHGEVPDGAVDHYVSELSAQVRLAAEPFETALAGGGTFGGRTLFCGVGLGAKSVRSLSALANDAAESVGLRRDQRAGGRPHLTLARASASRGDWGGRRRTNRGGTRKTRSDCDLEVDQGATLADWARALAVYQGAPWPVQELCVVSSKLGAGPHGGPLHQVIAKIPLA